MLTKKWIALILLITVGLISGCGCNSKPKAPRDAGSWEVPIVVNAGDFGIGDTVKIQELVANPEVKGVLIDFWATWCEPCKAEMPFLQDIYDEYKAKGLAMVVITIDNSESLRDQIIKDVKENIKHKGGVGGLIKYPIGWDLTQDIKEFYGITSIPVTYLINKENKIVYEHSGFTEELIDDLKNAVKDLIEGEESKVEE